MPTYGEAPSTLYIPYNATPETHVSACFAAAARSSCIVGQDRAYLDFDAADALPPVAMVQLGIHVSYVCISVEVCRQIRVLLVWRGWVVKSGGGPLVPRHSYGGHRVELWRASDWLKNDKKRLKIKQSRQTRVYLGYIRTKSGTMRSGLMAGLAGYTCDLISERTCFWP